MDAFAGLSHPYRIRASLKPLFCFATLLIALPTQPAFAQDQCKISVLRAAVSGECRKGLFKHQDEFYWTQDSSISEGSDCKLRIQTSPKLSTATIRLRDITFYRSPPHPAVVAKTKVNRHGRATLKFRWQNLNCFYSVTRCGQRDSSTALIATLHNNSRDCGL